MARTPRKDRGRHEGDSRREAPTGNASAPAHDQPEKPMRHRSRAAFLAAAGKARRPKGDYTVGYGRPPVHSRWKKGQSGNPNGRKRGSRNIDALIDEMLFELVPVLIDGELHHMPSAKLHLTQLRNAARREEPKAVSEMNKIIMSRCQRAAEPAPVAAPAPDPERDRELLQEVLRLLQADGAKGVFFEEDDPEPSGFEAETAR